MSNRKVTDSIISEKWFRDVSPAARKHLLSSLENLREGAPTTPTFKLYGKSDWSVVTDFLRTISSSSEVPKWLLEYEYSRKEKFGPQGGHRPWSDLKENAEMYFSRVADVSSKECDTSKYSELNIMMMSAPDALSTLKKDGKIMSRAAGWRAFNLKKTDEHAQSMALSDLRTGLWLDGWGYFFSRYNKKKPRLFVPMPYSCMIRQAQYFNPFLKAIKNDLWLNRARSKFRFWADKNGFDFCFHEVLEPLMASLDPTHIVYVMRDFDKMDTSTGPSQKKHYFVPKLAASLHFGAKSSNYLNLEDAMLFSNKCPIATPDGMWTGDHGEASGATVTNGGETCCNEEFDRLFQQRLEVLCSSVGITYTVICSLGNGDDGMTVYYLDDLSRYDEFAKLIREAATFAADATKFIIQSEKWDIHLGTYGKYCQYIVDWNGQLLRAMYPASLILNSICNPERQYKPSDWDKDYKDLDVIQKLANGRELPYFHELIDYVDNGLKYPLLGRDEIDTHRILSKYDKYLSLQDGSLEFNKWNDENIYDNPVVVYILSKRRSK